jgi:predicted ATPase
MHKPNFFVLTGGPGVGKTSVLRCLERHGERVVEENARAVIREEMASGALGMPWIDNRRFVDLTTARDIADFERLASENARIFFDRGIMDMWGANGSTPSPILIEAVRTHRYNARVFVFPPWREIYETDAERRQHWDVAEATLQKVLNMLHDLDYTPLIVPKADVEDRVAFILDRA